jgi:bifunctional pyridoxal-dependent enzyme with beta-cystathionase and maltose regulon repressor activities
VGARRATEEQNKMRDRSLPPLTPSNLMQQWFIDHARVQVNAGGGFGTGGEERMRMNCATSRAMLQKALDNIATAVRAV